MAPTLWSLRWGLCVMGECTLEDGVHQVYAKHVYVHHSHTLITEDNRAQFHTPVDFFSHHQSIRAWQCCGVSGSLPRGTCDLSIATSRWFPMVLHDTAGATCAWISSLDVAIAAQTMRRSWDASVLHGHLEAGLWVWEYFTDHCWRQQHITDTSSPTCAAIRQCPSNFQQAYSATPFNWPNCENRCTM